jgi:hypothetical protein
MSTHFSRELLEFEFMVSNFVAARSTPSAPTSPGVFALGCSACAPSPRTSGAGDGGTASSATRSQSASGTITLVSR